MLGGPDDQFRGRPAPPGSYDHLIDAEREALSRSGQSVGKIGLIRALREATGLGLKDAKDAVDEYLARRASGGPDLGRSANWIDDLLDAERAAALREDRPLTKILLIKALRGASGLGLRQASHAVEDYLGRREGKGLQSGRGGWPVAVALVIAVGAVLALVLVLA